MITKPLTLTIVIPAYNESRHLRLCLDSISIQDFAPSEVIVVDNNSTDDTVAIAKEYSFVKVVKESKQGIYYARNKGFNSAKSEIIARIDADTILPNNWVSRIEKFYEDGLNRDIAWTSAGYFYNMKFPKLNGWIMSQLTFRFNRLLLGHYVLWGSTMAITSEQWIEVKSQTCERTDIHEDLDLAIHLHRLDYRIFYDSGINVAVYLRRVINDRDKLWKYLQLWPQTLRVHNMNSWIFGWCGALTLYVFSPLAVIDDRISKLNDTKLMQKLKIY
jgi:glycosyltransferase involved in cell wall biosynthesis